MFECYVIEIFIASHINLQIEISDLDFWNSDIEILKLKENEKLYPPRFVLDLRPTTLTSTTTSSIYQTAKICFSGIKPTFEIALPLKDYSTG